MSRPASITVSGATVAAAITGFIAVALGAFGAHALDGKLSVEAMGWWETATFYGLIHAVAALALTRSTHKTDMRASWAFVLGAVLFSGSLYLMAAGFARWLGMITPLGGVCFLAGWALAGASALRRG